MKQIARTLVRFTCLVCALSWAGLIYYLSDQPAIEIPPVFLHQDKLLHLGTWLVLGFLTLGALQTSGDGYSNRQLWLVITLTGLYGLLDEYHQSFIPGRDASIADGLADISGAVLGTCLMFLVVRRVTAKKTSL